MADACGDILSKKNKMSIDLFFDLNIRLNIESLFFAFDTIIDNNISFDENLYSRICEICYVEFFCSRIISSSLIYFVEVKESTKTGIKSEYKGVIKYRDFYKNLDLGLKFYIDKWQIRYAIVPKFLQLEILYSASILIFLLDYKRNARFCPKKIDFLYQIFALISDHNMITDFIFPRQYYNNAILKLFKQDYPYYQTVYIKQHVDNILEITYYAIEQDDVEVVYRDNKEIFPLKEEIYEIAFLEGKIYEKKIFISAFYDSVKIKINNRECIICKDNIPEIKFKKNIYLYENKNKLDFNYVEQKAYSAMKATILDLATERYSLLYQNIKSESVILHYAKCMRNIRMPQKGLDIIDSFVDKTGELIIEKIECLISLKFYNQALKEIENALNIDDIDRIKILCLRVRILSILNECDKVTNFLNTFNIQKNKLSNNDHISNTKDDLNYHVVFNADQNYIKYIAVIITNIIYKLDKSQTDIAEEKFYFHILTDFIDKTLLEKLKLLQKELSLIFPCEIFVHKVDPKDFEKCPKWQNHTNHLCYFKIKLADYLPQDIHKCLFMDADMLVRCDLREIFDIDLENKIAAVTPDCSNSHTDRNIKSINPNKTDFILKNSYFNVGFMLINLKEWRKNNIKIRSLNFLKSYIPRVPEQDTLNFVIGNNTVKLSPKWNFFIAHFLDERCGWNSNFKDERMDYIYDYTRENYEKALTDIKVIHFTYGMPKPWESIYKDLSVKFEPKFYPFYNDWWDIALKTPIFGIELRQNMLNMRQQLELYSIKLSKKLNILENRILYLESMFNLDRSSAHSILKNDSAYKLSHSFIVGFKNSKKILKPIIQFFKDKKNDKNLYNNIEIYEDYEQSQIKIKKHLSSKVAQCIKEHPFTFLFRIKSIVLEFRKERQ
ncbi:glycosyltransferase family 8 protein [Campylobacter coli]|uniref:glycosyltransferase family 8 protein n=1 Tax=Campylobacter coli TaxID=195 RepID=UPI0015CF4791|nr:glycosyltransferase family 8 protein [Campylobacter coli]